MNKYEHLIDNIKVTKKEFLHQLSKYSCDIKQEYNMLKTHNNVHNCYNFYDFNIRKVELY